MKRFCFLIFLIVSLSLHGQVLEVPTLKSKGINGKVKTIEWHSFQAVKDKGEVYVKKDVETYDDQGRLSSILTQNFTNNQSFKTIYTVDKKGVLQQVQIVNPSNNSALRTTGYEYKKGLLVKTTQSQGVNTIVKNYSYNKSDQLIKVEVIQNGTVSLEEFYELDNEDRRTKISRKLPTDTEAKETSTFTYELKDGFLTSIENRSTEQGEFTITKTTEVSSKRDTKEVTKRLSDGVQGVNSQFFEDDDQGNWIKGEVIGDQYSRSRLVLRKFFYEDGSETGRDKIAFPDDYHAQFIRQYSQKQVAVNGKVYNSGVAFNLDYTDDRLAYVADMNAWVLLKNYDKKSNMTAWDKAEVIAGGRDKVLWAASSDGIDVFNAGRKFTKGTSKNTFSSYEFNGSHTAYIRGDINKSFVARDATKESGKVHFAELVSDHFYWGKKSDSTYVLTNRGRSVGLQKQIEDADGNKLAMYQQGSIYYWYFLPDFRDKYDNQPIGTLHSAESVYDPQKFLQEGKLQVDLSSFGYTKLANTRYRLLSADNQSVTNITNSTFKTPDNQLVAYFPLTGQYLQMENFYELENGKEWTDQKVSIVSDSTAYVYYLYNNNESINFYTPEGRITKRAFANHRLNSEGRSFGAVVYDSANNVNYGMNYNLDSKGGFGPMRKLIVNGRGAYALKLEGERWVIFEKGIKVEDYTFSKLSKDGSVVHFYKDKKGITRAMVFPKFKDAKVGHFIYANESFKTQTDEYLKEFGFDADLTKSEASTITKGEPLTYDSEGGIFYARDEEGLDVGHQLAWFVTNGINESDMLAYDSVAKVTYLAKNYDIDENITQGKLEVLIRPDEVKAIKLSKSDVYFFEGGLVQGDMSRSFITQKAEDKIYREVFFDQSESKSYEISYPSDSGFHLVSPKLIPPSHNHAYIFRINEERFVMIEKGNLTRNKEIRSRVLGNDLIRRIPVEGGVKGYRFGGYKSAELMRLIPAEEIPNDQFEALWTKAGEQLSASSTANKPYGMTIPTDKWMTAINQCGSNQKCVANLIDQMGVALKNGGIAKEQIELTLIPYLVGVGVQNKDRLFDVFMVLKSDYIGTMTNTKFPAELRKYIRDKSSGVVSDYTKKYGSQKIKTVPYKGKKGGNL